MSLLSKQPKTYFPGEEVKDFCSEKMSDVKSFWSPIILVPNCPVAKLAWCHSAYFYTGVPKCPGVKLSTLINCPGLNCPGANMFVFTLRCQIFLVLNC